MASTMEPTEPERVPLATYAILNLVFWILCLAQHVIIRLWLGKVESISFFFVVLAASFTLVSIFDYIYGLLSGSDTETPEESHRLPI